jgi:hypothetical protein
MSVIASLEKSRNSLQTRGGMAPLFMFRCDRNPVMLTWLQQLSSRLRLHDTGGRKVILEWRSSHRAHR